MGPDLDRRDDAALLRATPREPEAFGLFYRRHVRAVLSYLMYRTRRPELAADLCAEVFATALERSAEYDPQRGPVRAWLLMLAQSKLSASFRRGKVEDAARRRLGMPRQELTDHDMERVEELVDLQRGLDLAALVDDLPPDQRDAVRARVVSEEPYDEIAGRLGLSEAVVRQRVSRGLRRLRQRVEEAG